MRRSVREFELGPQTGAEAVAALVGAAPAGRERVETRTFVDTFDGRLHAQGVVGLAGEPADDRLTAGRALLPVARVRVRVCELAVLDAEQKTVVRLTVEHPVVLRDGEAEVPLAARVVVREVLGYRKAYDRAVRALEASGEAAPPETGLFEAAARAAGRDPAGVSSKVRVPLTPGMSAGAAAAALLTRLADVAEANVAGTLDDLDVEFLHDLRVAVRRARSVLRELREVFAAEALAHVRAELRWVQEVTGPTRDLDVQLADLEQLAATLDAERRADLAPVRDALRRRRARALAELRRALRGARFAAALSSWRDLAAAPGGPGAGRAVEVVAAQRIARVHRQMVRHGRGIADTSPDEDLHDLRKRGKELRYLLELFGSLFPEEVVKPLVRALKDLQDVLGRFQDRAVQTELLAAVGADVARRDDGPAALMALGLVVEQLRADQGRARAEFHERFERFAAKDQRRLVKRTFT